MPIISSPPGVASIAKSGSTKLKGNVTLSEGSNVTLTQSGNDISIAASSSGGGALTLVTSGTFTADTSLTGLDLHTAQMYKLIVQYEAVDSAGNRRIAITFNSDTTGIYYNTQKILYDTGAATGEENIISTLSLFSITCGGSNVTATNGGFAEIDIIKMDSTNYTSVKWTGNAYDHGDARKRSYTTGGGTYASTTNVTSIQIDSVVSTMDSGRYWLFKISSTV